MGGHAPVVPAPPAPPAPPAATNLSRLYGRWTFDSVIEAAAAVANDFVKRPRQYRAVPNATVTILSDFRSRYGTDPDWPNAAQRAALYSAYLGSSDGKSGADKSGPFHHSAASVREAAVAFSERVFNTGEPMLRQAFLDAAAAFASYLATLPGSVVTEGHRQTQAIFDSARTVLRAAQIAQAFGGLPPAPADPWPLGGPGNGDGAVLMEEIGRTLQLTAGLTAPQQQFIVLERIAYWGALTIAAIGAGWHLPGAAAGQADALIGYAYAWATSLRSLSK